MEDTEAGKKNTAYSHATPCRHAADLRSCTAEDTTGGTIAGTIAGIIAGTEADTERGTERGTDAGTDAGTEVGTSSACQSVKEFYGTGIPYVIGHVMSAALCWGRRRATVCACKGVPAVRLGEPRMSTQDCRLYDRTYAAPVYISLVSSLDNNEQSGQREVLLGHVPVIAREPGEPPTFIVHGMDAVIQNRQCICPSATELTCSDDAASVCIKALAGACTVVKQRGHYSLRIVRIARTSGAPFRECVVPVSLAMRCLGSHSDRETVQLVVSSSCGALQGPDCHRELLPTLSIHPCTSANTAHEALSASLETSLTESISALRACFPGASSDGDCLGTLASAVAACMLHEKQQEPGDLRLCRLVTAGEAMRNRFQNWWTESLPGIREELAREVSDLSPLGLSTCFDDLFVCGGDLDCVTLTGGEQSWHPSSYAFICPVQVPQTLARAAVCSSFCEPHVQDDLRRALHSNGISDISGNPATANEGRRYSVKVDGIVVGFTDTPATLVDAMRKWRRAGKCHAHTGLSWNVGDGVHVRTIEGRPLRPLVVAAEAGAVQPASELVDPGEAASLMIAMPSSESNALTAHALQGEHTHSELDPSYALSRLCAAIPFAHTCSVDQLAEACTEIRACQRSNRPLLGKGAVSNDRSTYVATSTQRPLVRVPTQWPPRELPRELPQELPQELLDDLQDVPFGVNAIVAVTSAAGYGPGLGIVMNRASVERGLFSGTRVHTIAASGLSAGGSVLCDPRHRLVSMRAGSCASLDATGLARVSSVVACGDAVIGRVQVGDTETDTSVAREQPGTGVVADALAYEAHGEQRAKVVVYDTSTPAEGDTFASRYGAAGVCSRIVDACDMPCTADGIVPDMAINPHAFVRHIGIGQLLEGIVGRKACLIGDVFGGHHAEFGRDVSEVWELETHKSEILINPQTGSYQECETTVAPAFYMHTNACDDPLDDQDDQDDQDGPCSQRAAEMEMCSTELLAHGASACLTERLGHGASAASETAISGTFVDGAFCVRDAYDGTVPLTPAACRGMTCTNIVPQTVVPRQFLRFQHCAHGQGISIAPTCSPDNSDDNSDDNLFKPHQDGEA